MNSNQNNAFIITKDNYLDILKNFDETTYLHSINTQKITELLLDYYNEPLQEKFKKDVSTSALFHDLGKIFIPSEIISKPSKLTPDEYNLIKRHPLIGANYYQAFIDHNETVLEGILDHHEKCDGSGYPRALKGDSISLAGKFITIADIYDAFASRRTYRDKIKQEYILFYFENNKYLFDEKIVNLLLNNKSLLNKVDQFYNNL